ncbi:MAG: sensor histidine kinase [Desulfovibrionaceae bacterium]
MDYDNGAGRPGWSLGRRRRTRGGDLGENMEALILYVALGSAPDSEFLGNVSNSGFQVRTVAVSDLPEVLHALDKDGSALVVVDAWENLAAEAWAELGLNDAPIVLTARRSPVSLKGVAAEPLAVVFPGDGAERLQLCLKLAWRRWRRERALAEKADQAHSLALKEIHHRVKNHLNVVQSFLHLQEHELPGECRSGLKEAQLRIRAVALVHDLLSHPEKQEGSGVRVFFERLARTMIQAYGVEDVSLELSSTVETLHPRRLVPIGLIVTELASNALRHGLSGRKGGRLTILLERRGESLRLVVRDNGRGLPDGVDLLQSPNLGLTLVLGLVEQLRGQARYASKDGLEWEIVFPEAV